MNKLIIATVLIGIASVAQAHPYNYNNVAAAYNYGYPLHNQYNSAPVYYGRPVRTYNRQVQQSYNYGYAEPSISFGVGGGSSRVYFTIPLR